MRDRVAACQFEVTQLAVESLDLDQGAEHVGWLLGGEGVEGLLGLGDGRDDLPDTLDLLLVALDLGEDLIDLLQSGPAGLQMDELLEVAQVSGDVALTRPEDACGLLAASVGLADGGVQHRDVGQGANHLSGLGAGLGQQERLVELEREAGVHTLDQRHPDGGGDLGWDGAAGLGERLGAGADQVGTEALAPHDLHRRRVGELDPDDALGCALTDVGGDEAVAQAGADTAEVAGLAGVGRTDENGEVAELDGAVTDGLEVPDPGAAEAHSILPMFELTKVAKMSACLVGTSTW
jgi:hypothetical protein